MVFPLHNKWLLISAIFLFFANIIIRLGVLWPPHISSSFEALTFFLNDSFNLTTQDAYDAMEYLYLAQKGRAYIAPVVEHTQRVVEAQCFCSNCKPTIIINEVQVDDGFSPFPVIKWITNTHELFHIFSAHLDHRPNSLFPQPSVQILAVAFNFIPNESLRPHFCHFASSEADHISFTVKSHIRMIWQRGWDPRNTFYNAYLITCPVPKNYEKLFTEDYRLNRAAVTVLVDKCPNHQRTIQFIRVTNLQYSSKSALKRNETNSSNVFPRIGICVKGMDFLDGEITPMKMIEWIELQYALGADSLTVYVYYIPIEIVKIFEFYSRNGKLTVIRLELPGESPNMAFTRRDYTLRNRQQKRRHELIPYNDCFYRYVHDHHFVLIIDIDEVVVPLKTNTWQQILFEITKEQMGHARMDLSALSVQNVFVFSGMNTPGSIFDIQERASIVQERGLYGKSFINTQSVATVFNHFALHRLHANVSRTMYVDENIALKFHFKNDCPYELKSKCTELRASTIPDDFFRRYRNAISKNVDLTTKKIF